MIVVYLGAFVIIVMAAIWIIERFFPKLAEKIINYFDEPRK